MAARSSSRSSNARSGPASTTIVSTRAPFSRSAVAVASITRGSKCVSAARSTRSPGFVLPKPMKPAAVRRISGSPATKRAYSRSASPSRDSHTARLLLVQAAVGRVLHEGLVQHPAHLVALHLLVRRPEDADRVSELLRLGVRQRREDLHDVVVRLREDLLVVDLQLLLQHGDRAGLVLAEGGDRLYERVDVPLHDGAVGGRIAPLHDEAVVHDRQLQARHVEERVQTLRLELVAERRLVEAALDRAGLQRGGPGLRPARRRGGGVLL